MKYINSEKLINSLELLKYKFKEKEISNNKEAVTTISDFVSILQDKLADDNSVQKIDVTLCKDCKYGACMFYGSNELVCTRISLEPYGSLQIVKEDEFCSKARRKDVIMVRVKSVSKEGTYYLVNGWNKYQQFWHKNGEDQRCHFKDMKTARASLTKLLNAFPEYLEDEITFEEI